MCRKMRLITKTSSCKKEMASSFWLIGLTHLCRGTPGGRRSNEVFYNSHSRWSLQSVSDPHAQVEPSLHERRPLTEQRDAGGEAGGRPVAKASYKEAPRQVIQLQSCSLPWGWPLLACCFPSDAGGHLFKRRKSNNERESLQEKNEDQ